jgi:hypothetical protein
MKPSNDTEKYISPDYHKDRYGGDYIGTPILCGGAGFIGSNIVQELKSRRYEIPGSDLINAERDSYFRDYFRNSPAGRRYFRKTYIIICVISLGLDICN